MRTFLGLMMRTVIGLLTFLVSALLLWVVGCLACHMKSVENATVQHEFLVGFALVFVVTGSTLVGHHVLNFVRRQDS